MAKWLIIPIITINVIIELTKQSITPYRIFIFKIVPPPHYKILLIKTVQWIYTDDPNHYDHSQKWITFDYLITAAHVKVWDILDDKLTVGSRRWCVIYRRGGRNEDLSDYGKGQVVTAIPLGQQSTWSSVSVGHPRFTRHQGSSRQQGNEFCPVWYKLTEGLLWLKLQKMLMMGTRGMWDNTLQQTLLHLGLRSCRPVCMPTLYPQSNVPTKDTTLHLH